MSELFYKHKKLIIILTIILIICVIAGVGLFFAFKSGILNFKSKDTYSEQVSYNNSFSIDIDDTLEFEKQNKNNDYDLILKSQKYNSEIYVSSFDSSKVRSIEDVIEADKKDFTGKFKTISDSKEISSADISSLKAYTYNFKSSNRLIKIYYIILKNKVYVFDFDIDKSQDYEYNLEDFTDEIIESFKIL